MVWLFWILYISIYILELACQFLQNPTGILIVIALNLYINFMKVVIITILSHFIHVHDIYLHLFWDLKNFLSNIHSY